MALQYFTFTVEGIGGDIRLADIDDAVDVERDLLGVGAPVLVAEAVGVFAVVLGSEGVVAVGDGLLVGLVLAVGVGDLSRSKIISKLSSFLISLYAVASKLPRV
jgi:hypothetical protein